MKNKQPYGNTTMKATRLDNYFSGGANKKEKQQP
jgi:hypothetical protein